MCLTHISFHFLANIILIKGYKFHWPLHTISLCVANVNSGQKATKPIHLHISIYVVDIFQIPPGLNGPTPCNWYET